MINSASCSLSKLAIVDPDGSRIAGFSCSRLACRNPVDSRVRLSFPVRSPTKCACSLGSASTVGSLQRQVQLLESGCDRDQSSRPRSNPLPDRWMEDCVFDIVRNVKEAPVLHLLYDSKGRTVRTQTQSVPEGKGCAADRWKEMKDSVAETSPDGVILVRHLDEKAVGGCWMADFSEELASSPASRLEEEEGNGSGTDMWGVLVLGRGVAKSACYILETTSVASTYGTCTRFCLTKAKCFGPSWQEQMQRSWLLGSDSQN